MSDKEDLNPYEENWRPLAPRPEWDDPEHWEAARNSVPETPSNE